MSWNRNLINLRDVLASLYPDQKESRMLVREVGLNPGHIDFDNRAVLNWYNILDYADKQNKVGAIVDAALVQFPENHLLALAREGKLDQIRGDDLGITNNWKAGDDSGQHFEKITGDRSTLLDIAFLELGMERSRSVGRVLLANQGGTGSGFLVEGNILITNNHVFPSAEIARGAVVQFNFQQSRRGMPESYQEFKVLPDEVFATSQEHDWTAIKVEGDPIATWGALSLDDIGEVKKDDHVVIIQHPGGGPKQIGLFHNLVTWVGGDLLQYLTDTMPGSSGSPVFNNQWKLVGLHHSGGWLREPGVKEPVFRNEGINIRTVIRGLEAAGVLASRKVSAPAGVHSSAAPAAAAVPEMARAVAAAPPPAGAEPRVLPMAALSPTGPGPSSLNLITGKKTASDPASFNEGQDARNECKLLIKYKDSNTEASGSNPITVKRTTSHPRETPWDCAHRELATESGREIDFVEPDFIQQFPTFEPPEDGTELEGGGKDKDVPDNFWPSREFGWHLWDEYSQLGKARNEVRGLQNRNPVRIGILDTGYDPLHDSLPEGLQTALAKNFTGEGDENNAVDPGGLNSGHGTATMGILAGSCIKSLKGDFNDLLGGAPQAEVVPIRVANIVVLFSNSGLAQGIYYAVDQCQCQVISISMGGVPSQFLADAVNYAYEKGVTIFAAAGNRLGKLGPKYLVWPARYQRVVAVTGYTSDKTPYFKKGLHGKMQGCFGPEKAMAHAMAAYTPNIPWAEFGSKSVVSADGRGTSAATPQCAAAAALWLQKHAPPGDEPWMKVEAVRQALFRSADKNVAGGFYHFGNGLLRAADALLITPQSMNLSESMNLMKTPKDRFPPFALIRSIGGLEAAEGITQESTRQKMLETEAVQIYLSTPSLQAITDYADPEEMIEHEKGKKMLEAMSKLPETSLQLSTHLTNLLK